MARPYIEFKRIAPCLFAIIVDYMGLGLVYPLVTAIFTKDHGAVFPTITTPISQNFYLGLAYLLYPLFMFFGAALLGDLSDKYGRKKVLLATMIGIFASFVLMTIGIFAHSITTFLVGRAASGLMAGSQPLCMAAIVDLSTPENKAWNLSLVTLTNCIGLVFGPIIAGIFTTSFFLRVAGFPLPFIVAAIISLIGFFLIYAYFEETYTKRTEKKIHPLRPVTLFIDAFKEKKIRFLWSAIFITMISLMLYYQTIGIYMSDTFHYSSAELGYFYAYIGIFFAFGIWYLVPFALKLSTVDKIAPTGFIIMGFFMIISILYKHQFYVLLTIIPFAATHAMAYTASATLFSNLASEHDQGWILGLLASANALAFALAGLSPNLLPLLGTTGLLILAGLLGILSGLQIAKFGQGQGK